MFFAVIFISLNFYYVSAWAVFFRPGPGLHDCNLNPAQTSPAKIKNKNFSPSLALPERETEILSQALPGLKEKLKLRPKPGLAQKRN